MSARILLAAVYSDGIAADASLARLGYGLRTRGVAVAGLVQSNSFVRDRVKCDMDIEELASGALLRISEYRGNGARGCRLDHGALAEACGRLTAALDRNPALLVLNKFGKVEAEGRGLCEVLAIAAARSIPTIVGVPDRNLKAWRAFAGDLAEETETDSPRIGIWLRQHGIAHLEAIPCPAAG